MYIETEKISYDSLYIQYHYSWVFAFKINVGHGEIINSEQSFMKYNS